MYKTIVVHLGGNAMPATLALAADLALAMDAHLIGTATSGMVELNYLLAVGAPMAMMPAVDVDLLRTEAEARIRAFEARCAALGVASFESRLLDTSAADALLQQSRFCDLIVVGQEEVADYGMLMPARLPGAVVTQAARPVLLVPPGARPDAAFGNVLIAWNGSLGASRAIAFALPLIRRAAKVWIAVCNAESQRIDTGSEPGADLATYLARHHDNVEVLALTARDDIHGALCRLALDRHADLMVAGAFGHGRLHDWILGSTTEGLITHTPVPLLMTH